MIKACEPLTKDQMHELYELAAVTTMNDVKLYLLEKQDEYFLCLQLFFEGTKVCDESTSSKSKTRVFKWIRDKLKFLKEKSEGTTDKDKSIYAQFKREIVQNIR